MCAVSVQTASSQLTDANRLLTAQRVFKAAFAVNVALTTFLVAAVVTGGASALVGAVSFSAQTIAQVVFGVLFFDVLWGAVWFGLKNWLLKAIAKLDKPERQRVFSSRMSQPFSVDDLVARHSERRIRIVDMIGRRGRFMTIAFAAFFYLYSQVNKDHPTGFATAFLAQSLLDAVITNWLFIGLFYANHWVGTLFYGAQTRVMDGVLARANCLLIVTLWSLFKFILVPIGAQLALLYSPEQFAAVFALIWGSYMVADTFSEVGGALYGRQKIRVWGIGDVNRKSWGGTLTGFFCGLAFCIAIVAANGLGPAWFGLALVIALANTVLELFSPRGTDDFTMATANALICWAFGAWVLA
jgi:hypothetical protein